MERFDRGRAVWLARFVLPHEPALRAWLQRRRHLPIETDDIVQESYAILAGLASVDHIQNPRAYLFTTANSLVLRELRRARVVSIRAVDDLDALGAISDTPSPEAEAASRQELAQLAQAMNKLPKQCREAFKLRKIEGYSQREIAEQMGVAESTVEKHVAKAIRLLMDAFGRGGKPSLRASSLHSEHFQPDHAETRDKQRD